MVQLDNQARAPTREWLRLPLNIERISSLDLDEDPQGDLALAWVDPATGQPSFVRVGDERATTSPEALARDAPVVRVNVGGLSGGVLVTLEEQDDDRAVVRRLCL